MAEVVKTTFRLRRGDIKTWEENNPVLKKGEPGVAYENGRVKCLKIGDGISPWNKLEAIGAGEASVSGDDYIYIGTDFPPNAPPGSLLINEGEEGAEEEPKIEPMEAYTTITKTRVTNEHGRFEGPVYLNIHCHNLVPGEKYKIYMYKAQRQQARTFKGWKHSPNYDFDDSCSNTYRLGYATLVRQKPNRYSEVPSWMPNQGYLQTEWEIPEYHGEDYVLSIDFNEWILPMIKEPDDFTRGEAVSLIGLRGGTNSAIWTKWKIVRLNDGAVGECNQLVKIGQNMELTRKYPTLSIT